MSVWPWPCRVVMEQFTSYRKSRLVYHTGDAISSPAATSGSQVPRARRAESGHVFHRLLYQPSHHCEDRISFIFIYINVLDQVSGSPGFLQTPDTSAMPAKVHDTTQPCLVSHLYWTFLSVLFLTANTLGTFHHCHLSKHIEGRQRQT